MPVFICRICGFSEGEQKFCPTCEEPLVELTDELLEEHRNNQAVRNAASIMRNRKWY